MLFDSNVIVYEDSNVALQEFDFRTRAMKKIDFKSKKRPVDRERIKKLTKQKESAYHNLAEAPVSVVNR